MNKLFEQWQNRQKQSFKLKFSPKKIKQLKGVAENLHNEVFAEIDCLSCANCCKSIPPKLNRTDISRIAKYLNIKSTDFENQYVKTDEDGDTVISSSPCTFLMPDNSCSIYDVRPKACRQYPHTDNFEFFKHLKLHQQNTQYCPAVFHILDRFKKETQAMIML